MWRLAWRSSQRISELNEAECETSFKWWMSQHRRDMAERTRGLLLLHGNHSPARPNRGPAALQKDLVARLPVFLREEPHPAQGLEKAHQRRLQLNTQSLKVCRLKALQGLTEERVLCREQGLKTLMMLFFRL